MRPIYETEGDLRNEREIAHVVATSRYPFRYAKLGKYDPADYLLHDQGVSYFVVEIKDRDVPIHRYQTYIISRRKLDDLLQFAAHRKTVGLLAVRWSGGEVGVVRASKAIQHATYRMGGRTDRGDAADIEELAEFPIALFDVL